MRNQSFIIAFVIAVVFGGSWFMVSAQTWVMPYSPPPDNTTMVPLTAGQGDNMGDQNPHTALYPLDLQFHRLYNIRSTNETSLDVTGKGEIGVAINCSDAYGLRAITYSPYSSSYYANFAGLKAVNTNGYPALVVESNSGKAAVLYGTTTVEQAVTFGSNPANQLGLSRGSSPATSSIYWGNKLLCDPTMPNCGWLLEGQTGDGLGNHKADKCLNMDGHFIYDIGSASETAGDAALNVGGNNAVSSIDASAVDGYGVSTRSQAGDPVYSAGLYALATGSGPAIISSSWLGNGLRASGPVEILDDASSGVKAGLKLASTTTMSGQPPPTGDILAVSQGSVWARAKLYWGDKLLCDPGKGENCGWATNASNNSFWLINDKGIHNPNFGIGKVLIGRQDSSYNLEVGHNYLATESTYLLGGACFGSGQAVAVRNSQAYVGFGNTFRVMDISNPQAVKLIGFIDAGSTIWGIALGGKYAYLATKSGLVVMDISKPATLSQVKQYTITGIASSDYPTDVVVSGGYAYLVADRYQYDMSKLYVFDISDPANPVLLKEITGLRYPTNLTLYGNKLIVADKWAGVNVYDITDSTSPTLVSNWRPAESGQYVSAVAVSENRIYAAGSNLFVLDLNTLDLLGTAPNSFPDTAVGITAAQGYVYLTVKSDSGEQVIRIYDVDNPAAISWVNNYVGTSGDPYTSADKIGGRLVLDGTNFLVTDRGTCSTYNKHLSVMNNQGFLSGLASAPAVTVDWLAVPGILQTRTLTTNSLTVGVNGLNINGGVNITAGNRGLKLGNSGGTPVILDQNALKALLDKCQENGGCV